MAARALAVWLLLMASAAGPAAAAGPSGARPAPRWSRGAQAHEWTLAVANTCGRDWMRVRVSSGRPFYGVIHAKDQRHKPSCALEGTGDSEHSLDLSLALEPRDPAFCGAFRHREPASERELLSIVVAVRWHRNIELSDDRYYLLNCTK